MLGRSKIKTVRTIVGHLGLMARLVVRRMRGAAAPFSVRPAGAVSSEEAAPAGRTLNEISHEPHHEPLNEPQESCTP